MSSGNIPYSSNFFATFTFFPRWVTTSSMGPKLASAFLNFDISLIGVPFGARFTNLSEGLLADLNDKSNNSKVSFRCASVNF